MLIPAPIPALVLLYPRIHQYAHAFCPMCGYCTGLFWTKMGKVALAFSNIVKRQHWCHITFMWDGPYVNTITRWKCVKQDLFINKPTAHKVLVINTLHFCSTQKLCFSCEPFLSLETKGNFYSEIRVSFWFLAQHGVIPQMLTEAHATATWLQKWLWPYKAARGCEQFSMQIVNPHVFFFFFAAGPPLAVMRPLPTCLFLKSRKYKL